MASLVVIFPLHHQPSGHPRAHLIDWFHVKQLDPTPSAPSQHEDKLRKLVVFIQEAAQSQNLVSPADLPHLWNRHILDSISPLLFEKELQLDIPGTWIDMGSGAGLPVLPMSICLPNWKFFAIEPRRLRIQHLESAARELGLDNLQVVGSKAEAAALNPTLRGTATIVSARAVGKIPEDAKRALPFLGPKGKFITFKHQEHVDRIDGYHPLSYVRYRLPSGDEPRHLVFAPLFTNQAQS